MIAFINDHREAYGIEPICKVLPIALSTYHAHIAQRIDPSKRSARAQRDEALKIEVRRVFEVYCSPVLRHPAGLIQAANFRSAIAF